MGEVIGEGAMAITIINRRKLPLSNPCGVIARLVEHISPRLENEACSS